MLKVDVCSSMERYFSMADTDFSMWDDDKLDRRERANAFARIIQHSERARVISVEGGFGSGKTFFRTRWAQHLRVLGETVVEFDAWKSDHSGDPLSAFSFQLLRSLQVPEGAPGFGSQLRDVATTVAKAGFRRGSQVLVGEAVDQIGDELGELLETVGIGGTAEGAADFPELSKIASESLSAARKSMSKEASKLLLSQFEAERVREVELPQRLQGLRRTLVEKGRSNGRVVVLIDELDRCRPDYAISLLEAIKHLFNEEGFVFVLFLNPAQLASTAARLFGNVDGGEPYFTKFIDLRLELGENSSDELCKAYLIKLFELNNAGNQIEDAEFVELLQSIQSAANELDLTPRQIEKVFTMIEVTMATSEGVDLSTVAEVAFYATSNLSPDEVAERLKPRSRKVLDKVLEMVLRSADMMVGFR